MFGAPCRTVRRGHPDGWPPETVPERRSPASAGAEESDRPGGAAGRPGTPRAAMCPPTVAFGPNANKTVVSALTLEVLTDCLTAASVDGCRITSTSRTPADQARVMYRNLLVHGVGHQRALYAAPGDAVIAAYERAGGRNGRRPDVLQAMEAEIRRQGPSRVSRHCADPTVMNVVDVAPSSIPDAREPSFIDAVERAVADGRVSKFLGPHNSSDPAYHLEVPQEPTPVEQVVAVPRVPVVTRSEWGAKAPRGRLVGLAAPHAIVVHHTAQGWADVARAGCSAATGKAGIRKIQDVHFRRRFSDVGYHFAIDGGGRVYQGRPYRRGGSFGPGRTPPTLAHGAHVGGKNSGRIGVNVMGCFGGAAACDDTPSDAALEALARLVAALSLSYGVALGAGSVVGHRDLAATVCPGDALHAALPAVRARAQAVLEGS